MPKQTDPTNEAVANELTNLADALTNLADAIQLMGQAGHGELGPFLSIAELLRTRAGDLRETQIEDAVLLERWEKFTQAVVMAPSKTRAFGFGFFFALTNSLERASVLSRRVEEMTRPK